MKNKDIYSIIGLVLATVCVWFALMLGIAFVLEWAWNMVMNGVFALPKLGYWTSFALLLVVSILLSWSSPMRSNK